MSSGLSAHKINLLSRITNSNMHETPKPVGGAFESVICSEKEK